MQFHHRAHSTFLAAIRFRTWFISVPILVGTLMEIVGYTFRILASRKNPYSVIYFVGQYFCIVVAPALYSAAIFGTLSMLIQHVGSDFFPLRPRMIFWLFITCDAVATIIQVVGASLIGSAYSNGKNPNLPNRILLAGLIFQVASFPIFI
jgi:hypothetical protein